MRISRPTESAYETAAPEIREVLDQVVAALGAIPEWPQRTGVLIEMIDALDLAVSDEDFDEEDEDADGEAVMDGVAFDAADETGSQQGWEGGGWDGDGDEDEDEGGAGPEPDLAELTTYYVGAVLERLDEKALTGPEQAAFYMLSCHPEHLEAAQSWLGASPGNQAAFEAFVDANPDYAAVLDMVEDLYADLEEDEEE